MRKKIFDIEQKRKKLLKTEKKIEEPVLHFIYMVAHELRTPLSVIKSSAELLSFYQEINDQRKILQMQEQIGIIHAETERLNTMLDDLLLLAKIESGKISPDRKAVNILPVINDIVVKQNAGQPDGRNISLIISGLPVKIILEKGQLERILDNVISNAFKYSQGKPAPELHVHFTGSDVQINVKDFGIGIPEDEQHRVYHTFFRAGNTENIHGNGLGLMIVRHLINLNDGNIQFVSRENEGSVFVISFPYPVKKMKEHRDNIRPGKRVL